MQERRYKVIKVEKSKKAKEDIGVGLTKIGIGAIAYAIGQHSGLIDNSFLIQFLTYFGGILSGEALIDIFYGLKTKTYIEVPDELIERYDNEKGRKML